MKLDWTLQSLPEITGLSPSVRAKNVKDAHAAAVRRPLYWLGIVISVGAIAAITALYPALLKVLPELPPARFGLLPGAVVGFFIWRAFTVMAMRKYYPHILRRVAEPGNEADGLIQEADDAERRRWRIIRFAPLAGFILIWLALL